MTQLNSYKTSASTSSKVMNKKKAIVIGSGFGGLSSAIRLQASGFDVQIFEKRDKPGGRAYVFEDKGFKFDAGPTVITAPHCIEDLFTLAQKNMKDYVELLPITPFYRLLWQDGYSFDYNNDPAFLEKQIKDKSPSDWPGYLKFLQYSKEVFAEGYTKLVDKPFLTFSSMIKVAPQLIRLRADRSVYATVARFIKDENLREVFSFHSLLVGGNPFVVSSIYTLIHYLERNWGVFFPRGGTGALVQGLVRLFEDLGGKIHLNAEIEKLNTLGNKVQSIVANGKTYDCDLVVSNADVVHTYEDLLKSHSRGQQAANRLKSKEFSMSLFVMYFGTKKKYPGLAHHTILFGPRYKELLEEIFDKGTLPNDFSLYLHVPTVTDPSLAPDGHEGFYVLSPVGHLGKLKIDWDKESKIYADKIMTYLEKRLLPGLKENLVTFRIFNPQDFKTELNSHLGSAFSLEPRLTQSAFFRVHNRDDVVENLYFVGAGTHPGAGLPGVINSGKATADLILKDYSSH
ncbi:MAG: phytoene desaturase [Pseudobdellovibrionaceae bacterium]